MKKETFFKAIALGAMVVGGIAIAKATTARIRRERDEAAAANAMIEAEIISENFSGYGGSRRRKRVLSGTKGDIVSRGHNLNTTIKGKNVAPRGGGGGSTLAVHMCWCKDSGGDLHARPCNQGCGTYEDQLGRIS